MVGANHKHWNDPSANDLQIWHRNIPQLKKLYSNILDIFPIFSMDHRVSKVLKAKEVQIRLKDV
jgi:hypothetical protein